MESKFEEPIRILNVVPNMRAAGIETAIMNVYKNINREKVQFDFLVHSKKEEFYDKEIISLGGRIYRLAYKDDKNFIKYIRNLRKFFLEHNEYKIVHGHMQSMMPIYLKIAKSTGIKIRIAHAHNSNYEKTLKGSILHILSRFSKKYSNVNFACSKSAGKYLFGNNKFTVIYNGINLEKFIYNSNIRNRIRDKFDLNGKFVIGHVGRFELQKNHIGLIKIFSRIYESNKDAILLLIGEGKLIDNIKKEVKDLKLEDNVIFLGVRDDVNKIMQAMDCFLLPSLYEGLPVVGIEAQIAGLPSIFSNNITEEVKISNNCFFINNNDLDGWKNKIMDFKINLERSGNISNDAKKFDARSTAKILEKKYLDMIKGD